VKGVRGSTAEVEGALDHCAAVLMCESCNFGGLGVASCHTSVDGGWL
jgi:hypothetical protein